MKIIGVFDDPRFMDQYTVVLDKQVQGVNGKYFYQMLAVSNNPRLPNEVSIFGEGRFFPSGDNSHLGESIPFDFLPMNVQTHVLERLENI